MDESPWSSVLSSGKVLSEIYAGRGDPNINGGDLEIIIL